MSSANTINWGWRATTSARALSSAGVYIVPVGLLGELMTSTRLLGVMTASSWAGVILKSLSTLPGISTTLAPARRACSG